MKNAGASRERNIAVEGRVAVVRFDEGGANLGSAP